MDLDRELRRFQARDIEVPPMRSCALFDLHDNWPFLHVLRQSFHGSEGWGTLYMIAIDAKNWDRVSYTYELPWIADARGQSKSDVSQIEIGTYEMQVRTDGPRGWRLELLGTKHRKNIQVHRAHHSMYIEGCLLPVHFNDFQKAGLKKGDQAIETRSMAIMNQIKGRYNYILSMQACASPLHKTHQQGKPTITISAILPASIPANTQTA